MAGTEKAALQEMVDSFETLSNTLDILFDDYAKGQGMTNLAGALETLLDLYDTEVGALKTLTDAL